jgi:hypothetical protein
MAVKMGESMSGSHLKGLAPEAHGPTITIGKILVEIMARPRSSSTSGENV